MPITTEYELDQKLELLPKISFDDNEEFQRVVMSQDFTDIFNFYRTNDLIPPKVKILPETTQRIAAYLALTGQDQSFINQTEDLLYCRRVPDINEFLRGDRFLGPTNNNLYPYWEKKLHEIFAPQSIIKRVLWGGATGTGKGLVVDDIIPTPNGKRKVKDLVPGDYLWGKNGKKTKILDIFDRGFQQTYKLFFDDGSTVVCDGDHLWKLDSYKKHKTKKEKIVSTFDMFSEGISYQYGSENIIRYKFKIPTCDAVEYEKQNYDIHPYVMGALLGDGYLGTVPIIANNKKDHFIIEKIQKLLPNKYKISNYEYKGNNCEHYGIIRKSKYTIPFNQLYKKLNLFNTHSYTKFIPENYKRGSIEQRYELIRGLLDTDGTIQKKNNYCNISYCTVSKQMAYDVIEIIRSLGGRAKLSISNRINKKNNKKYIEYYVLIYCLKNPFSLPRKAKNFLVKKIQPKVITKIEKLDLKQTRCFLVDSQDHLFLCNDYIVTHNTTIAREAMLYSLYKIFCLRNPRSVLNVSNSTTLAVFILSVTQKTAEQTNFNPILDIIKNMKCFQQVRSTNSFDNFDIQDDSYPIPYNIDKSNTTIRFANNIILTTGSQISNTVGYDIVISVCDEINEKGVKEGMEILNSIDGRLDSRFAGSPFTFQHVMSSARGTDSVTKEYSRKWAKDPTFLYLHPMRFEVKQTKDFIGDGTTFPILIGNGVVSNKIITDPGELAQIKDGNYEPPNGCEIVNVPTIYRNQFEADLEQQIQDMLGIDTQDSHFVFKDLSRLVDDSLLPEIHLEANINNNNKLIDLIPKEIFTTDLNGKIRLKRAPSAPRYIHADLSTSGECDTGLCMLHKEYIPNEITGGKTPIYVVDFVSYITAKNEVDLEAVKNLCIDLVVEKNVPIHTISADQYQSTLILQQWKNSNCFESVEQLSVDRTSEPYTSAATLVTTGRVKVGKCDKLKRELENLVIQNGKIMKTIELKDMADGLVGSLYSAQKNYQDIPYYLYTNQETLNIKKDNYGTLLKTDQFLVDI